MSGLWVEDFYFEITERCIGCGACMKICPVQAISAGNERMKIDSEKCIDCGTCLTVCPRKAPAARFKRRGSIGQETIHNASLYMNTGCALRVHKPYLPAMMLALLRMEYPDVKEHDVCCKNNPNVPDGSIIITNCASCDRRFRTLYEGVQTITFWEIADSMDVQWPDYSGRKVSVHDSCKFREKPQVRQAVRSLLAKMKIEVEEAELYGADTVCCGRKYNGVTDMEDVRKRQILRAQQMPFDDVVVYCAGCANSMNAGGKHGIYLMDLMFGIEGQEVTGDIKAFNKALGEYAKTHTKYHL